MNDDESDAVAWFPLDALPRLDAATREKVARAAGDATDAWFEQPVEQCEVSHVVRPLSLRQSAP